MPLGMPLDEPCVLFGDTVTPLEALTGAPPAVPKHPPHGLGGRPLHAPSVAPQRPSAPLWPSKGPSLTSKPSSQVPFGFLCSCEA